MIKQVAVLGGGNGGHAFVGHLGLLGFEVKMYESPQFQENINSIKLKGGIELSGAIEGFGKVRLVSSDMKEVVNGAQLIIIAVPAFAHSIIMEELARHLEEGQLVLIVPGNYGSIRLHNLLKNRGLEGKVLISEAISMLYACRMLAPGQVYIRAVKNELPIAALPSSRTQYVIEQLNSMYKHFVQEGSILEASFNNMNCIVHTTTSILNAGWIERTKGDFDFYWDGITESVGRVMEIIDQERLDVGRAMGFNLPPFMQVLKDFYGLEGANIYQMLSTSEVHGKSNAPENLKSRYVTEDVAYGLVPLASFGRHCRVNTPAINALIELASGLNGVDYWQEGITVEKLGLKDMNIEDIRNFIVHGH